MKKQSCTNNVAWSAGLILASGPLRRLITIGDVNAYQTVNAGSPMYYI